MKNFENPGNQYSEHEKNRDKSINELSKFILDNLDRPDFKEFVLGGEVGKDKLVRWQGRWEELIDKITKRLGHKVDQNELKIEVYKNILDLKESGELNPSKYLDSFCEEIEPSIKSVA